MTNLVTQEKARQALGPIKPLQINWIHNTNQHFKKPNLAEWVMGYGVDIHGWDRLVRYDALI